MPFLNGKKELFWTNHALAKMRFYKLSAQRIGRVLNSPKRIEEGIALNTIAMMQPFGNKSQHELWVMIQETKMRRKIISAWRYPGRTKPRSEIALDSIKKAFNEFLASNLE